MTAPIPNCPQPETPIREMAWTDAQKASRVMTGVMAECDFASNTITLKMDPGYFAAAGQYELRWTGRAATGAKP